MSEEVLEVVTDPPGDMAQDKMQQQTIQHMLNTSRFIMSTIAHELQIDMTKASSIMLSVLSTTVMVFIRGYPREHWADMFREVAEYFTRMATEAEVKGADNGGPKDPDS